MYKSRAIPTLTGKNAEYFREIQTRMEHAAEDGRWSSVGEAVCKMMRNAGEKSWAI